MEREVILYPASIYMRDFRILQKRSRKRAEKDLKERAGRKQVILELLSDNSTITPFETLLGVTGSGKTFTMFNVIQALNKPTLIIAHNKTLAAQLYGEFKEFFPENAVEYFVS